MPLYTIGDTMAVTTGDLSKAVENEAWKKVFQLKLEKAVKL